MRQGLCNGTVSFRLSVRPSVCPVYRPLHPAAAGLQLGRYTLQKFGKLTAAFIGCEQPTVCAKVAKKSALALGLEG